MFISKKELRDLKSKFYFLEKGFERKQDYISRLQQHTRELNEEIMKMQEAFKLLGIERHVQKAEVIYRKIQKVK